MDTQVSLICFRNELKTRNLNGYIIPRSDIFGDEEVQPANERLCSISGFSGSAGLAIIIEEKAKIFVDGRYILQVKKEVSNQWDVGFLKKSLIIDWLKKNVKEKSIIGFDPWILRAAELVNLSSELLISKIKLQKVSIKIFDKLWLNRPKTVQSKSILWNEKYFGQDSKLKVAKLCKKMDEENLDALFISKSSQICWLLNLRGKDLKFSPLIQAFAIILSDKSIHLFVGDKSKLEFDQNLITIYNISSLKSFIAKLNISNISLKLEKTPFIIYELLKKKNVKIVSNFTFLEENFSIKSRDEIELIRNVHIRDGVALVKFLFWLKNNICKKISIDEFQAAQKLSSFRAYDDKFVSDSFPTISASGQNSAIVHYKPTQNSKSLIKREDLFLIDSGGQYFDGTTDITRTISFKIQNNEIKKTYTRVLQSHIALATAVFPEETKGNELDIISRQNLWKHGLDYNHGTGHGVGYFLEVHETPPSISRNSIDQIKKGMLVSNEPGYYKEGGFGVRIENLMIVDDYKIVDGLNFLKFKTLSLCPLENSLIVNNLLAINEKKWINNYHLKVRKKIAPFLTDLEREWLFKNTEKLL